MNPCKECIVDMVCIKECPMFKVDLSRLQTDELIYIKRTLKNIDHEKYKGISEWKGIYRSWYINNIEVRIYEHYIKWYKNGSCHRDNDQPAIIDYNGDKFWCKYGKKHRDNDKPALIFYNGSQYWYKNGERHRDNDQPAVILYNGSRVWYKNDKRHRDNDQPAIIWADGTEKWYKNGKLHRDNDQPAIIFYYGRKEWWRNGVEYEPM